MEGKEAHHNSFFNEYSRLNMSAFKTPDQSSDVDASSQVRFSKGNLKSILNFFISTIRLVPIEKYEVDLFKVTRTFHVTLQGKEIDIKCLERIHHIQRLINGGFELEGILEKQMKAKIEVIIKNHPMVTVQYDLFCKMLEIWNGLLVKWGIAQFKNYDYRYTGRALNVKLLDLEGMNKGFITADILWISSKLNCPPLCYASDSTLLELSSLLHDQLDLCFGVFLMLNPKEIDPDYDIEKTLAFTSRTFMTFSQEILPEENLSTFRHAELRLVRGMAKCFKTSDPKTEHAFECLRELEMAFRSFEKTLIGNILKASGNSDF